MNFRAFFNVLWVGLVLAAGPAFATSPAHAMNPEPGRSEVETRTLDPREYLEEALSHIGEAYVLNTEQKRRDRGWDVLCEKARQRLEELLRKSPDKPIEEVIK